MYVCVCVCVYVLCVFSVFIDENWIKTWQISEQRKDTSKNTHHTTPIKLMCVSVSVFVCVLYVCRQDELIKDNLLCGAKFSKAASYCIGTFPSGIFTANESYEKLQYMYCNTVQLQQCYQ